MSRSRLALAGKLVRVSSSTYNARGMLWIILGISTGSSGVTSAIYLRIWKKRPQCPPSAHEIAVLLTLEALSLWVACPALWTVTCGTVLLGAAQCLFAAGILHDAGIGTLFIDASFGVRAVRVSAAFWLGKDCCGVRDDACKGVCSLDTTKTYYRIMDMQRIANTHAMMIRH